jgi:glycosyltransferase involved in cell wall biosynthesis
LPLAALLHAGARVSGGPPPPDSAAASVHIADALVLTFTAGVSLVEWDASGILDREWALYARIGGYVGHVVLVTWGGRGDAEEHALLTRLRFAPGIHPPRLTLISCDPDECEGDGTPIATRVHEMLLGHASALVKTNRMRGGHIAAAIAGRLRSAGIRTALIARGGYPWSRFIARERGAASPEARAAAIREGELCRAADLVVATTSEMADDLAWRYELPEERFAIIPNYVAVDALPPGGPAASRLQEHEPTILFAGRLERQKRLDRLIEAIALLPRETRAGTSLCLVEDGSQADRLRALAGSLGINARFEPRMPHAELLARMRTCTVYAQTSDYEGHPRTVLEAMAAGAPVLVCDTPGLGASVQDGITGLRVPARPDAIARGLLRLLSDPLLAQSLGMAAADHIGENFSLHGIVQLETAAYRRALAHAAGRAPDSRHIPPGGPAQEVRL